MLRKLINKIRFAYARRNSDSLISYYKDKGVRIGEGTIINNPKRIFIDISRPELVEIGNNVLLHSGTVIMAHDFASRAFVTMYSDFIPSHGKIKIGNNVWFGENVTILKGVTIGDNVIIGYGAVVTKSIPSNSVAVGFPAKVISSFDNYYNKRKEQYLNEAVEYALAIIKSGREPRVQDFADDYPCFVDGENHTEYDYPYYKVFNNQQFEAWKKNHRKMFNGFDDFMNFVKQQNNEC